VKIDGKVVVVTGAGSGIGTACARRFAAEGAHVVGVDIVGDAVRAVGAEIGGLGLEADVCDESAVRGVVDEVRRAYGPVDLWFSNAGISEPRAPGSISSNETFQRMWELHVMSHVYATRAVLPEMLERGSGYLLQTVSNTGLNTSPHKVAYTTTKHAALGLGEWLAINFRPRGIAVSCFCPNAMLTPMLLANEHQPDDFLIRTAMHPDDVAEVVLRGIGDEEFLILSHPHVLERFRAKAADYEAWVTNFTEPR
jgi:NAD(P)-dependent dehydrogenase (short-subunit alcohol dehydrogenase family)